MEYYFYKNCESLYCTSTTYIMCINYTLIKISLWYLKYVRWIILSSYWYMWCLSVYWLYLPFVALFCDNAVGFLTALFANWPDVKLLLSCLLFLGLFHWKSLEIFLRKITLWIYVDNFLFTFKSKGFNLLDFIFVPLFTYM